MKAENNDMKKKKEEREQKKREEEKKRRRVEGRGEGLYRSDLLAPSASLLLRKPSCALSRVQK